MIARPEAQMASLDVTHDLTPTLSEKAARRLVRPLRRPFAPPRLRRGAEAGSGPEPEPRTKRGALLGADLDRWLDMVLSHRL
jgi:hypothetical protein